MRMCKIKIKLLCKNWNCQQHVFHLIKNDFVEIFSVFQSEADKNFLWAVSNIIHQVPDCSFRFNRWRAKLLLDVEDFCAASCQHVVLVENLILHAVEVAENESRCDKDLNCQLA